MKTLADFKRLEVGTKLLTVQGRERYKGKIREIEIKHTNAIKFKGGSWLEYPKAKSFRVEGQSIFIDIRDKTGEVVDVLEYIIVK